MIDTIFIDCCPVSDPASMHDALAHAMDFPEYYGKNLDALYDCLTDAAVPTRLILLHFDDTAPWAHGFREVFEDAMQENPLLQIVVD